MNSIFFSLLIFTIFYLCNVGICLSGNEWIEAEREYLKEQKICKHGASYFDGCADCRCKSGLWECPHLLPCPPGVIRIDPPEDLLEYPKPLGESSVKPERKCRHGASYNDGCNNVFCSYGIVGSTLAYCIGHTKIEAPADFWEPESPSEGYPAVIAPPKRKCKPGASYFNGCNECHCPRDSSHGLYKCPRAACPPGVIPSPPPEDFWEDSYQPSVIAKPKRRCRDGASYYDGCNQVFCQNGNAGITLRYCSGHKKQEAPEAFWESELPSVGYPTIAAPPERRCRPGAYHFDGCNSQFCEANGNIRSTQRFCPDKVQFAPPDDFYLYNLKQLA